MNEESAMTVQAIKAHISLNVRNIGQSIEFYKKMLGIEPSKVQWLRQVRRAEPAAQPRAERDPIQRTRGPLAPGNSGRLDRRCLRHA